MKKLFQIMLAIVAVVTMAIGLTACGIVKGDGTLGVKATQLATPTGLRIEGGNLCWNPVEYASQYTVSIDGAEYYCSDYKYSLDGVKDGEHVFNVKTNGDGVLYTSSAFSAELRVELEGSAPVSRGYYGQFDELTKNESFLGYGFDVINSSVFSDKYIKTSFPLFDNEKLMQQRLVKVDSKHSYIDEIESSDMEKFVQQWNVNANVNVSWGKKRIGGSVGVEAAYSGGVENAKSKYFHCISITNQKFYIVLQSDIDTYKSMVKDSFANDLYSDMEPAELFNLYGTHFITSAVMGGKINSYYLYSSSEEKSYHDFSSTVSTEVRYMVGKTNVEVSGGYRQEFEKKNVYVKNTLDVIGGSDLGMLSDADIPANYKEWEKSLNDHASLMGIKDSSSLIPIWKLIDASKDTRTYTWDYTEPYKKAQAAGKRIEIPSNAAGTGNRATQLQAYFNAYGFDSYNALMEAAGLPTIKIPESIENVRINNLTSDNDEYEVYAGSSNDIGFTVSPADATGYTKTADISGNYPYARITNEKGVLALEIDSDAPVGEVLDIILSAGSVRKTIKVVIQKNYVVKFNSNGGTPVDSITVVHNGQIDEPPAPTKENRKFGGWYTDAECTNKFLFGDTPITKNITLYAKWNRPYTVTFNTLGGSSLPSITVFGGDLIDQSIVEPTKEGAKFTGWFKEPDCNAKSRFFIETDRIESETILYAGWTSKAYLIKFDSKGGTTVADCKVAHGETIGSLPQVEKTGYTFKGWFMDEDCTIEMTEQSVISGDMTLYAKWEINKYIVRLNANNGESVEERTIEYNQTIGELPTPERLGYTFDGWYDSESYTREIDSSEVITKNATYFAKWTANVYTVRFENTEGATPASISATYNTLISLPIPNHKFGRFYTFNKWKLNGSDVDNDFKMTYAEDITLKSSWYKTYSDYNYISNRFELENIATNQKNMLICNIDLSGSAWSKRGEFTGELEGNGFAISGLNCNIVMDNNGDSYGLFKSLNGASVKNITFNNVAIFTDNDADKDHKHFVGTLAGTATGSYIYNVHIASGYVKMDGSKRGSANIGGIVGHAFSCVFTSCSNKAYILAAKGSGNAGGIVGLSGGTASSNCIYKYCWNTGEIEAHNMVAGGPCRSAGIAGYCYDKYSSFTECWNSGVRKSWGMASGAVKEGDIYNT